MQTTLIAKRFILGCWRLNQWGYTESQLSKFLHSIIDLGIVEFDHADIYGDYECEKLFGQVLKHDLTLRPKIKLTSKCGIKLVSDKFPAHLSHIYDTSFAHIVAATDRSLSNLNTDYLDLLLIHRPDPLMSAHEVAKAFNQLKLEGKVLNFGVSNFLSGQFELLQSYLDFPLVTNQIEASVLCHEHFDNGNFDYLQMKRIIPQIWSPLAGGKVLNQTQDKTKHVLHVLEELAQKHDTTPETIALSWLLKHPTSPQIILGSGNYDRVAMAIQSLKINLTREEWFKVWTSYKGHDIP